MVTFFATENVKAIIAAGRLQGYLDFEEAAEDYHRMPTVVNQDWLWTRPKPKQLPGPQLLMWVPDEATPPPEMVRTDTNVWVSAAAINREFGSRGPAGLEVFDWHLPVLDVDIPRSLLVNNDIQVASPDKVLLYHPEAIRWVPSTTPGHHHVYIDWPMPWPEYEEMLLVLLQMEVLQPGYVRASIERGYSCVRKPGVMKPPPPEVVGVPWPDPDDYPEF